MQTESSVKPRMYSTAELPSPVSDTEAFFKENFPDILEKGRTSAQALNNLLAGQQVKRSYFYPASYKESRRDPCMMRIARVQSEDVGIVRVYDTAGVVREFPAVFFSFTFGKDAILCIGPHYSVLFEVIKSAAN